MALFKDPLLDQWISRQPLVWRSHIQSRQVVYHFFMDKISYFIWFKGSTLNTKCYIFWTYVLEAHKHMLTTKHSKSLPSHFYRCVLNVCNQDSTIHMQFENLGWQVHINVARTWQHLIFCQNLDGCTPTLPTHLSHPCICKC